MATSDPKLQPLHKTLHALKEIRSSLLPFLKLLQDDADAQQSADDKKKNNNISSSKNETSTKQQQLTMHKRAEAEAAVALAIGTLRYMGSRLKGLDRGRKKGDPLRKELDQIRGLLVSLRKIESEEEKKKKSDSSTPKEEESRTSKEVAGKSSAKRRSDDDTEANNIAASGKKNKKQKTSK